MSESGLPSPQTVSALLIVTTILHALALILTSFRLWFRHHIRRFWWDDIWAALALLCDAVCMVVMWTFTAPLDNPYINFEALPTPAQSRSVHIISFWLAILFYTCSIWFARISIVFSVVRIVPPARGVSMAAVGAGGMFFCMWAYMLACKSVVCSVDESWYDAIFIECPIPEWVAISEVCTDALSDIILVVLPLRLLWRVKLPLNQRIMVLSVFSTSILVSVFSAVHTSYIIPDPTFIGGITAQMGGAISLIVCNLLVIVTFIYRVTRNGRDLTAGLSGKNAGSSNRLTTVDLEFAESSWFTSTTIGTETGFTGTGLTGTNISGPVFVGTSDRDTPSGPTIATGDSVLPGTSPPLASIAAKQ